MPATTRAGSGPIREPGTNPDTEPFEAASQVVHYQQAGNNSAARTRIQAIQFGL